MGGSLGSTNTILLRNGMVDDGATYDGHITLGASGLAGQIILNASAGSPSGLWGGDITVGSVVLNTSQSQPNKAPYYDRLSSTLGGGSVGLVKFNFHGADCSPVNAASLNAGPSEVLIEHYGPVSIPTANAPVKVEEAETAYPVGGSPTWSDVTANYDYAIASGTGRVLRITPKAGQAFNPGNFYRVSPAGATSTNRLKCAGIPGSVDSEYVYDAPQTWFDNFYHFTVNFSPFDLNESGEVDGDDVALWWLDPVDLDDDTDADLDDLDLLETKAGL